MSGAEQNDTRIDWSDMVIDNGIRGEPDIEAPFTVGIMVLDDTGLTVLPIAIKTIHGRPEVKTAFEVQCRKIAGIRICTKVPVIYHRESDLAMVATISFPSTANISQQIKDCVIVSATGTVIASAVSFQWEAASAELLGLLKACLIAKGVQDVARITVGVHGDIKPGPWH